MDSPYERTVFWVFKMSAFIESIRLEIRTLQYSLKTERTYLYWCRYFIRFNHFKHPNIAEPN